MHTRKCSGCGEKKEITEFAFRNRSKQIRHPYCRTCKSRYSKTWYQKHKPQVVLRSMARNRRVLEERRTLIREYLLAHPCVDCGETDPIVLEFDHRDGTKE